MEPILNKLVNSDQTGFVKRKYIRENIRLISDEEMKAMTMKETSWELAEGTADIHVELEYERKAQLIPRIFFSIRILLGGTRT